MLYSCVLMDVREDEGEYFYTICSAFDSKYAKEINKSTFLACVKRQEICNVKISDNVEIFTNFYFAVSEFINTYLGEDGRLFIIERPDLNTKKYRYFKFFNENGVNITVPVYQIVGRHTNYVLNEKDIALGIRFDKKEGDSTYCIEEMIDLINYECHQTLYDADIIKKYLFLK